MVVAIQGHPNFLGFDDPILTSISTILKGWLKHPCRSLPKIVRLLGDSGKHWSCFQGFHFVICSIPTFEILFLHCNFSQEILHSPASAISDSAQSSKSLGGKRWRFIFEGFWTKHRFYPRNLTDEQDWISLTRWAPTSKKMIYNPYR